MGATLERMNDPCLKHLDAYVRCAEAHQNKFPDEYGEYCEEEKER